MNHEKESGTHKIQKGILGFFMNLILIIFSLTCIFPIVWMIYSSLKEKRAFNADIIGLPKSPTLVNYTRILTNSDYHLAESMFNSVRTTFLSILLIVLFSFIVGYILARVRFKLNRILYIMFLMGMLIPIHSRFMSYSGTAVCQTGGLHYYCHMCPSVCPWESSS